MVKNDLVDELTGAFPGITKRDMSTIVNAFFESLAKGLERGEAIDLRGFGRLKVKERRPIKGRNPRTGKYVDLPRRWVVHFNPAARLAKDINQDKSRRESSFKD